MNNPLDGKLPGQGCYMSTGTSFYPMYWLKQKRRYLTVVALLQ